MINFTGKKILVLAPHTDDAELGAGGLIIKALSSGAKVKVITFSSAQQSLPKGFDADSTSNEFVASMKLLKVDLYSLLDYEVRRFCERRQEILEVLVQARNDFNPDLIVAPSHRDVHQDHQVISNECVRAFKSKTILMYEMPWNNFVLSANFFLRLDDSEVDQKISAIKCYRSQTAKNSMYFSERYIKSQMLVNSARYGVDGYSEAFEILRCIC